MSDIESMKREARVFPPPPEFIGQANISGMETYNALCTEAMQDYAGFWAKLARENLDWQKAFPGSRPCATS